ncbi:MAG: FecR domain-containing protein [Proteobacteria bacterium]|nr:FecR domain-containing protein [Pseudomonadota bacterium]
MSLLLRIALLLVGFAVPAMAQTVGVTSAASGEPRGTPPAQNERILRVGIDVFANERVRTGANDRAHLVFNDGSALSVGVNSEITIDRFVYDPTTRQGDLQMTAARGAFRFVGGAISKKAEVKVTTPAGNIGIRGGIVTISIGNDGSATVTFLYGDYASVTNAGGSQRATRAGSQIFVPYNGAPFPPVVLPPGSLQAYLGLFEQQQGTGNAVSPGDQAQLDALLAALNNVVLPRTGTGPGLQSWLTYLQLLSMQAITTTNANRTSGQPGPVSSPPPQSQGSGGNSIGGGGCGTDC